MSDLFQSLTAKYSKFEMLNSWVEALDCTIFPEHRFKSWYQIICDIYQSSKNIKEAEILVKIKKVVLMMIEDILSDSKPFVGEEIGLYNKQFIIKWVQLFTHSFGKDGAKVLKMNLTQITKELESIKGQIDS